MAPLVATSSPPSTLLKHSKMPSSPDAPPSVLHDEHALLAAYETRPTRPKRSSSERSKEFRAKRKKYEAELQHSVDAMRREVAELNMRRNIWQEKLVHMRNNVSGALIKLVREYYLVFQHGLAMSGTNSIDNPKAKYQLDFLAQNMHPNVEVNHEIGIPALIEIWRRYTTAHTSIFVEVGDVTIVGPDEDPVVLLSSKIHVQFARQTFELMFPGSIEAHGETLVSKFMDKHLTYTCLTYFRFTSDGRISSYIHDMNVFNGVMAVAESLDDVLKLMNHYICRHPYWRVWPVENNEDEAEAEAENEPEQEPGVEDIRVKIESVEAVSVKKQSEMKEESPSDSDDSDSERRKLTMNFLLT